MKEAVVVQNDLDDSQRRLDQHKLQGTLFAAAHKFAVHRQGGQAAGSIQQGWLKLIAIHLDFHRPRTSHIRQTEGQEVVYDKRLIAAQQNQS